MNKRKMGFLMIMSIFVMMLLSSCSVGVECGLIGKWENLNTVNGVNVTTTLEFTCNDKLIIKAYGETYSGGVKVNANATLDATINSVDNHIIKYNYNSNTYEMKYRNLACDSVEFDEGNGWMKFTKIY